ncbi:hypothetical protein LTR62_003327 [Meristemomyces frigidus]|uniref:Uncharacterized protein n=1 Tax=Meristemomyces frigidus TaxID=1508187 RepID=A0AAN7YH68_9PEZI|nr:hypothetical protein LTR62_003327 [Meristemomyces frigidus]
MTSEIHPSVTVQQYGNDGAATSGVMVLYSPTTNALYGSGASESVKANVVMSVAASRTEGSLMARLGTFQDGYGLIEKKEAVHQLAAANERPAVTFDPGTIG